MTGDPGPRRGDRTGGRRSSGGLGDGPIPSFDLYGVLGVRPEATQQEIVEAVAALDRRLRTAAARERPGSTSRLKRLNVARHWLADPARRRRYDAARAAGVAGAGAGTGRVRGRVGAGPASRRPGSKASSILTHPITIAGIAIVALVAAFLVLRPGGPGGAGSPSVRPSASGRAARAIPSGCPTQQPPAADAGERRVVTIDTSLGSMEITLDASLSPIAVGNFEALVTCGFYDGLVFHRAATLADGTPFVIQGGDPQGNGQGGPAYTIQDEPVTARYVRGTVAMARTSAPNSVGSQFFIVLDDGAESILKQYNTYQIIGSVTTGMEVADAIYQDAGGNEQPDDPIVMDQVTIGPPLTASTSTAVASGSTGPTTTSSSSTEPTGSSEAASPSPR